MIRIYTETKRFITVFIKRYKQREKEEPIHRERYVPSRVVILITSLFLLLVVVAYFVLFAISSGTYLSGWFFICAITVVILLSLSAPYSIVLTNKYITLHGYIDITQIPIDSILSIEVVNRKHYKYYLPLIVSFGYLGFFGFFLNLKQMEICRVYTTRYSNWIAVKTDEDDTYIFNVKNPIEFIAKFKSINMNEENKI